MSLPTAALPRHHLMRARLSYLASERISSSQTCKSTCIQSTLAAVCSGVCDAAQYSLKSSMASIYGANSIKDSFNHVPMKALALLRVSFASRLNCCMASRWKRPTTLILALAFLASRDIPTSSINLNQDPSRM